MRGWGSGEPEDLGSLEVKSFTPGAAAGGSAEPARRAGTPQHEELFHAQLARRLGELEVRGAPEISRHRVLGSSAHASLTALGSSAPPAYRCLTATVQWDANPRGLAALRQAECAWPLRPAHKGSGPHTRTRKLHCCDATIFPQCIALGHPVAASQNAAQAAGELAVAQPEGAAPLPPFERWGFREERYIQWLADMQAAHLSLEAAVADATTVASTEHYGAPPRRPPRRSLWLTCFCVRGAPGPTTLVHWWRRGGGC